MIKRILFFIESPFNKRDYNRFGVEILKKNGFQVDIWDLTLIFHPAAYNRVLPPDPIEYKHQKILNDKKTAVNEISKLANHDLVVIIIKYSRKSFFLFRTLSKHSIKYCTFIANALPIPSKLREIILHRIAGLSIEKFINVLFLMIPPKLLGVNDATVILAGGNKSISNYNNPRNSESKIFWIHALDYDLYLQDKREEPYKKEKYAVFLDEYLPFHPDYIMYGLLSPTGPDDYYPVLNKFFSKVENKFNVKVVIAEHPRSHYGDHTNYYESRECIKGETSKLIKNSEFVIAHSSTAINFAVLFEKPIIFVITKLIHNSFFWPYIKIMSFLLGQAPINLDNNYDITHIPIVNKNKYDYYRNSYIKVDGTPELPFWQIFSDNVKNI